jgi:hypothetical protein
MTCLGIVVEWLKEHGYDGLCNYGCGCGIDDISPAECLNDSCVPAYKGKDEDGEDGYVPFKTVEGD